MLTDLLFLAENVRVTNWLSSVWIISLAIGLGFLLVVLGLVKIRIFQHVAFFNSVADNPSRYWFMGTITSIFYLALFGGFLYWTTSGNFELTQDSALAFVFGVPAAFILGFGVWALMSRKSAGEFNDLVFDGFLKWINRVSIGMLAFALLGFALHAVNGFGLIRFFEDPVAFLNSLVRLPVLGVFEQDYEVPPSSLESAGEPIAVAFDGAELNWLKIETNRRIEISAVELTPDIALGKSITVDPNDEEPAFYIQRQDGSGLIPLISIEELYVKNFARDTATVKLTYQLLPIYREVYFVPIVAFSVFAFYFSYLLFATLCPKISAIALSTYKTEIGQPLFWLVVGIAFAFILITIFVPYNTFGEDIKMYTDSGLTLIRVAAIFLAIWAASKSVAEEIEGRTALTVLSKPVGRRQFVIGKFVGISMAIALLFILVGLWFYVWVSFKPIYDFQEASKGLAEWNVCFTEARNILPGLFLCFLEVVIFVAISVAISTRMGILSNFLICFSIYVLGHLTPLLVQSSLGAFEAVAVFGQVIAIVFPVLNHFDVQTAINTGSSVPLVYLAWSVIYTGVYGSMVLLLALVLFEDRDLA